MGKVGIWRRRLINVMGFGFWSGFDGAGYVLEVSLGFRVVVGYAPAFGVGLRAPVACSR